MLLCFMNLHDIKSSCLWKWISEIPGKDYYDKVVKFMNCHDEKIFPAWSRQIIKNILKILSFVQQIFYVLYKLMLPILKAFLLRTNFLFAFHFIMCKYCERANKPRYDFVNENFVILALFGMNKILKLKRIKVMKLLRAFRKLFSQPSKVFRIFKSLKKV